MSELKVNTISEVTGANGVVIDSVKLKDGEVYATKIQYTDGDDAITIADGGGITVAQAATFSSTIDSGAITSTGIVTGTAFTAGSAVLAEAELELLDGLTAGTAIASKVVTTDANIDTTGQRNLTISGELDAATLDISGAIDVAGTTNLDVVDIDGAVDMASTLQVDGVATFTAVPVFPNNTIETADIQADAITAAKIADNAVVTAGINADAITAAKIADNAVVTAGINADAVTGAKIADDAINSEHYTDGSIDTAHIADGQITTAKLAGAVFTGATDIGAAIVDADLLLMDDGAGGTIRKSVMSRLKTYIGAEANTPSFYAYGSGATAVANDTLTRIAVAGEQFDNGGCYNATANNATLNSLTSSPSSFTPNVAGLYFFTGAIMMNTASFNVGLVNNKGGVGGSETYAALVYSPADTANRMVMVSGFSVMNGSGNQVCLSGYQASGGSINTNDAIYTTYFGGFLVKAS